MKKVESLAAEIASMDPKAAGQLGLAFEKALGFRYRYVSYSITDWLNQYGKTPTAVQDTVVEKTDFAVVITAFDPAKKMNVIREIKAITSLGLIESKALVEAAPRPVKTDVNREEAERIAAILVSAGATVTIS